MRRGCRGLGNQNRCLGFTKVVGDDGLTTHQTRHIEEDGEKLNSLYDVSLHTLDSPMVSPTYVD